MNKDRLSLEEWLTGLNSYEDLCTWLATEFRYDHGRFKNSRSKDSGKLLNTIPAQTPQETFERRSGECMDVARFIKYCLKRILPESNPRILTIIVKRFEQMHFMPLFDMGGKIFALEYGSWAYSMHGLRGPFDSVEDIIKWYVTFHPRHPSVDDYFLGWPKEEHFAR
jgi:hypothetical protein